MLRPDQNRSVDMFSICTFRRERNDCVSFHFHFTYLVNPFFGTELFYLKCSRLNATRPFRSTRLTVCAVCSQGLLNNYKIFLELWERGPQEKLAGKVRRRLIGCQTQMKIFDFLFGLYLHTRVFQMFIIY